MHVFAFDPISTGVRTELEAREYRRNIWATRPVAGYSSDLRMIQGPVVRTPRLDPEIVVPGEQGAELRRQPLVATVDGRRLHALRRG